MGLRFNLVLGDIMKDETLKDLNTIEKSLELAKEGAIIKGWQRDADTHAHALECLERVKTATQENEVTVGSGSIYHDMGLNDPKLPATMQENDGVNVDVDALNLVCKTLGLVIAGIKTEVLAAAPVREILLRAKDRIESAIKAAPMPAQEHADD